MSTPNYLDRAAARFPDARKYADYREMIEKEVGKIDAVMVGTPDHHHAPASIRAIRAGLHTYCEKPLTHTVQEARILAEAAKKHGVATQLGTQIHAEPNYRRGRRDRAVGSNRRCDRSARVGRQRLGRR